MQLLNRQLLLHPPLGQPVQNRHKRSSSDSRIDHPSHSFHLLPQAEAMAMCQWDGTGLRPPLIPLFQAHFWAPQGSQRGPLVLLLPRRTLLVELLARCPTPTCSTPARSPGLIAAGQLLQGVSQVPRRLRLVA